MLTHPTKQVIPFAPASFTNAATASGNIDRQGFDFMSLDVTMSTSNDTTNNPSVLKLSESDDTVVTNFVDIAAAVGDGVGGFTIPNAVTEGTWGVKLNVDLRGRKRYLKLSASPVTTQVIAAVANLSAGDEAPAAAGSAGVNALVEL